MSKGNIRQVQNCVGVREKMAENLRYFVWFFLTELLQYNTKYYPFLFLTQEKKQKNMHLKRIAKSSLRFGKKNNSSPTEICNNNIVSGIVKHAQQNGGQADFSSFPSLRSDF